MANYRETTEALTQLQAEGKIRDFAWYFAAQTGRADRGDLTGHPVAEPQTTVVPARRLADRQPLQHNAGWAVTSPPEGDSGAGSGPPNPAAGRASRGCHMRRSGCPPCQCDVNVAPAATIEERSLEV